MGEPDIDPCLQNPCKASVDDYYAKEKAVEAACDNLSKLLNNPPKASPATAAIGGAALAGLGLVLVLTGVGAIAGGICIAGGAAAAAVSYKIISDYNKAVDAAKAACSDAHDAFERAKDNVTRDCPKFCWPKWSYYTCPV